MVISEGGRLKRGMQYNKDTLYYNNYMLYFRDHVDDREWRFLLTGGVALENPFPNPASLWLPLKSWGEIVRCSDLPVFKGFMDQFKSLVCINPDL